MIKRGGVFLIFTCIVFFAFLSGAQRGSEQEETKESTTLFVVIQNGKWGFINRRGKIVIEPRFDSAWDFSEGLAAVMVSRKWGYIDRTGKMVIKPQFYWPGDFSEGVAPVKIYAGYGLDRHHREYGYEAAVQ